MPKAKTPESPPELEVIEGEKLYKLRELSSYDTRTVGAMIARVTGDPRIQNALHTGEEAVIIASFITGVLDRASHDLYVWIANLIGLDKQVDTLKEYRRREKEEAREEGRLPRPDGELRYERELDIIDLVDALPPEVPLDVIHDIIESPRFERFLSSISQLGTGAKRGFERFQKPSKNGSDSQTKK